MTTRLTLASALAFLFTPHAFAQSPPHGLRVPPGFEVTEFADSSLANDIFCLTLDPKGCGRSDPLIYAVIRGVCSLRG
jgi:hypothetical protein